MSNEAAEKVGGHFGWVMAWGLLLVLVGVIAIAAPLLGALATTMFLGWLVLLGSAFQIVSAFMTRKMGGFAWRLILGVLYGVAGLWLLAKPLQGVLSITLALAMILIASGFFQAIHAFQIKPAKAWGWHLFDGIVSILLGVFILAHWPFDAPWVLGTYAGIALVFRGLAITSFACSARAACKAG
jgi:uncharacterized membrane protein HdeD (DUF308 family)